MVAKRIAISTSLLALILAGLVTFTARDSRGAPVAEFSPTSVSSSDAAEDVHAVPKQVVRNGTLLQVSESDWLEQDGHSPIDAQIWLVPPDDDHRLRVFFRLVNRTQSGIVVKPWGNGALQLTTIGHTLWVHPRLESEVTVAAGDVWSHDVSVEFGVDLPHPDTRDWKLQARVIYGHEARPHDACRATADLTFPKVAGSQRRLDCVLEAARLVAEKAYPNRGRYQNSYAVRAVDGAWQLSPRVNRIHAVRVTVDPDGTVLSHRWMPGCVRL